MYIPGKVFERFLPWKCAYVQQNLQGEWTVEEKTLDSYAMCNTADGQEQVLMCLHLGVARPLEGSGSTEAVLVNQVEMFHRGFLTTSPALLFVFLNAVRWCRVRRFYMALLFCFGRKHYSASQRRPREYGYCREPLIWKELLLRLLHRCLLQADWPADWWNFNPGNEERSWVTKDAAFCVKRNSWFRAHV